MAENQGLVHASSAIFMGAKMAWDALFPSGPSGLTAEELNSQEWEAPEENVTDLHDGEFLREEPPRPPRHGRYSSHGLFYLARKHRPPGSPPDFDPNDWWEEDITEEDIEDIQEDIRVLEEDIKLLGWRFKRRFDELAESAFRGTAKPLGDVGKVNLKRGLDTAAEAVFSTTKPLGEAARVFADTTRPHAFEAADRTAEAARWTYDKAANATGTAWEYASDTWEYAEPYVAAAGLGATYYGYRRARSNMGKWDQQSRDAGAAAGAGAAFFAFRWAGGRFYSWFNRNTQGAQQAAKQAAADAKAGLAKIQNAISAAMGALGGGGTMAGAIDEVRKSLEGFGGWFILLVGAFLILNSKRIQQK